MPSLGPYHPIIVHFVIGLLIVGVAARVLSLLPLGDRGRFLGPMAVSLILMGTVAAVLAAYSGHEAHEVVEQIPGVGRAVNAHEEWGENTRDIFLVVSAIELVALALASRKAGWARALYAASAVVGLGGVYALYQAGERGGDLVYSYAGGPGLRTGDTTDMRRLLISGLFVQARSDREHGNASAAATLTDQLVQMMPGDTAAKLLGIRSMITDRKDPRGALASLDSMHVPATNQRLRFQTGMLRIQAFVAAGMKDSADAEAAALQKEFPRFTRLPEMIQRMEHQH